MIEKIGVRLGQETDDHHLTINFQMGLVGDRIEYADTNEKSAGYTVVEGDKERDMVISNEQVQQIYKSSRIAKKKAVGSLLHQVTIYPHNSVTVE